MKRTLVLIALLLVPSIAAAQEDRLFRVSLVTAMAAHAAEGYAGEYCLGRARQSTVDANAGGTSVRFICTERNLLLGRWSDHPAVFGAVQLGVAALSLLATSKLHDTHPKIATVINFSMTAVFSAIAIQNGRVSRGP